MHGTLRFILATVVALSHLGITFYGYNLGVFSVVIFYLLAGMVAQKQYFSYFYNKPFDYYKNRINRIFPLYIFSLAISYIVYLFGAKSYFLSATPTISDFFANITIIPLAYFMYSGQDTFTLLPPTWSLGVELQFYILIPFLFLYRKITVVLFFISFLIYILAQIGVLHTDYFGYRLICGILFIFLLGSFLNYTLKVKEKKLLKFIFLFYLILSFIFIYLLLNEIKKPYNIETLFALLVGIPLLYFFKSPIPRHIDLYLGSLSYGIFLLHFPALWIVKLIGFSSDNLLLIGFITIFLSILGHETTKKK